MAPAKKKAKAEAAKGKTKKSVKVSYVAPEDEQGLIEDIKEEVEELDEETYEEEEEEDFEDALEPAKKRSRLGSNGDSSGDEWRPHQDEYSGREIGGGGGENSFWFEGSAAYKCDFCTYVSHALGGMTKHLNSYHNRQGSSGADMLGYTVTTDEAKIDCAVCGISVAKTKGLVERHLRQRHGGMTLADYEKR